MYNVMMSGPCVSPFDTKEKALAFVREFSALLDRYSDEHFDLSVEEENPSGWSGVVL